jgi:hypothetical protein
VNVRTLSDDSDLTLNFSEIKALASGNPLIKEKAELESRIQQLTLLERGHNKGRFQMLEKKAQAEERIRKIPGIIDELTEDLALLRTYTMESFAVRGKKFHVEGKKAFEAIHGMFSELAMSRIKTLDSVKLLTNESGEWIPTGITLVVAKTSQSDNNPKGYIHLPNSDMSLQIRIVKNPDQLLSRINAMPDAVNQAIRERRDDLNYSHDIIERSKPKPFLYAQELSDSIARLAVVDSALSSSSSDDQDSSGSFSWQGEEGRQSHESVFISERDLSDLNLLIQEFDGPWFNLIQHQMNPAKKSPKSKISAISSRRRKAGVA